MVSLNAYYINKRRVTKLRKESSPHNLKKPVSTSKIICTGTDTAVTMMVLKYDKG